MELAEALTQNGVLPASISSEIAPPEKSRSRSRSDLRQKDKKGK